MGNTKTKKTYEQNVPFNRFKKGKKFIIIMRHGERIDSVDKKSQILPKEDPELTQNGINQAINIGKKLRETFFKEIEISEMNIFSSPSARTLMTAIYSSISLNSKVSKNLCCITNLAEYGVDKGFKNNKKESPIYYFIDSDKEYKKLWDKFIIKPTKGTNFKFSKFDFESNLIGMENPDEMKIRFMKVMEGILTYSSTSSCNSVNFAVSHQLSICYMIEECFKEMNVDMNDYIKEQHCGYCSTYIFAFNEQEKLEFLGDLKPDI